MPYEACHFISGSPHFDLILIIECAEHTTSFFLFKELKCFLSQAVKAQRGLLSLDGNAHGTLANR